MLLARPKSRTLHDAARADLDVCWLQITMHDAVVVRRRERLRDLAGDAQRFEHRYDPRDNDLGQRRPVEHLHHEVVRTDVVERADVVMVKRRDRAHYKLEPGA
jgi:hypothetical protein